MTTTTNRGLRVLAASFAVIAMVVAQDQTPQVSRERIEHSKATVITEQLQGMVVFVEGNHLVVRMADGKFREFDPPANRKFVIDGREVTVRDLKPGTKLTATVTTTTTSVIDRTTTVGSATVWWVSGNTLILTLPNGENRTYTVKDDYKFTVAGNPATVSDLKKGMKISAQKIVEEPMTEIASNTTVVGQAPPPSATKAAFAK